ncbi:MAG: DUF1800 domain-containing protein [Myxococcota bacterium]|nr:DUF1800 domain-containing protein [Myxococcota bacterium]
MDLHSSALAAHRFGLGAAPGEIRAIGADPRGWLEQQLVPEKELPAPIDALPSTGDDLWAFFGFLLDTGIRTRRARRKGEEPPDGEKGFAETFLPRYETALEARLRVATATTTPFREHLVHFWSNHFVVSSARPVTTALPPAFERDVVRPHVVGRFEDMLMASSKHPAMLLYLDNERSIGPNSRAGRNPSKRRLLPIDPPTGLNENLAREILELHSLGVDGGYTQDDVRSFAKVLTGWRIKVRPLFRGLYEGDELVRFDARAHEPGVHFVLGKAYPQKGMDQGEAVLQDLARHPSTARFVATKLTRHFVDDAPPEPMVERLARVFRDTDGDLGEVSRALVRSDEAWQPRTSKLRRPEELVIAGLRALPEVPWTGRQLHRVLREMGQRPYWPPSPAGYSDRADDWAGADGVWKRLAWAQAMGRRATRREEGLGDTTLALERAADVLGPLLGETTAAALGAETRPATTLALLLSSPEFQRR